ncbi:MAG: hypothetical protein JRF47_11310 [Deltaproteobacteria bacterium]|jgi:hypothetical protein|nr:hypothetical protein [Deltaproteobacteria bacterium]
MITKTPLDQDRVRKIAGSFAFVEHRFLRSGFFSVLTHHELLLYVFLVLVADRNGLSYYSYDKICILLKITLDDYIIARDGLIEKDLIAFNGHLFQVLSLPKQPPQDLAPLKNSADMQAHDPATIEQIITKSMGANHD